VAHLGDHVAICVVRDACSIDEELSVAQVVVLFETVWPSHWS
jgi:hypothetical protein